jgi:DNA-binding NarL/FixJ family response regulator
LIVVEDEPLIRNRLESILHGLGYADDALIFAATLGQARARLAEHPVAMALVDLGLPDGSGIELISQLRAADPGMGILVISAWSTEDAILSALRAGANGYVLKERDDLEVTLSIRSVLRGGAPSTLSLHGASLPSCSLPSPRKRTRRCRPKPYSAPAKSRSSSWSQTA